MPSPIVFIDFAGPDDEVLRDFYAAVFDWQADAGGTLSAPASTSLECAIRKDPAEKRVYIGVPDVTECLSLIEASGGSVDVPRYEVPGVVVLGLFRDPAGNPMGLVEMDGDRPRIP